MDSWEASLLLELHMLSSLILRESSRVQLELLDQAGIPNRHLCIPRYIGAAEVVEFGLCCFFEHLADLTCVVQDTNMGSRRSTEKTRTGRNP